MGAQYARPPMSPISLVKHHRGPVLSDSRYLQGCCCRWRFVHFELSIFCWSSASQFSAYPRCVFIYSQTFFTDLHLPLSSWSVPKCDCTHAHRAGRIGFESAVALNNAFFYEKISEIRKKPWNRRPLPTCSRSYVCLMFSVCRWYASRNLIILTYYVPYLLLNIPDLSSRLSIEWACWRRMFYDMNTRRTPCIWRCGHCIPALASIHHLHYLLTYLLTYHLVLVAWCELRACLRIVF